MHRVHIGLLALLACGQGASLGCVAVAQVTMLYAPGKPQVEFAGGEIQAALKTRGQTVVSGGLDRLAKNAGKETPESLRQRMTRKGRLRRWDIFNRRSTTGRGMQPWRRCNTGPQLLTRVGYVDLNAVTEKVEHDIAIAKGE